ncbi:hypothetical protein [Hymenobacter sediminicola]|uniref:Uncharacterized protein n=1 Tax=Hymenobacter sediminicola TaxID=2761579 RepID=A0A7G7W6M6_9BACT|nr:hypothetical protein [Hymenobacter sediminicola]QNH62019.1 hypothetical protein H4317_18035 [Hymenobacter sediminicola]
MLTSATPGLLRLCLCLAAGYALASCAAVGRIEQLPTGRYRVLRSTAPALQAYRKQPVYLHQDTDTLLLAATDSTIAQPLLLTRRHSSVLLSRRFDVDVFTLPFKIRPARAPLPVQLNTSFNAALYLGRRLDFYHVSTPARHRSGNAPVLRDTGIGYGVFVGLGAAVINPDVTRQQTAVAEYEGLVTHVGGALIYDARVFNVGLAAGADHLFGPDRRHWIYQHRPWLGVLFGLDLN